MSPEAEWCVAWNYISPEAEKHGYTRDLQDAHFFEVTDLHPGREILSVTRLPPAWNVLAGMFEVTTLFWIAR